MSYALQSALVAIPMIGFTSLAIDLSWKQVVNDQLQNAADSGALAAVTRLASFPDEVVPTAILFTDLHRAGNNDVVLTDSQVSIGDFDGAVFTPNATGKFVREIATTQTSTVLAQVFGMAFFPSSRTSITTMRDQTLCGLIGLVTLDMKGSVRIDSFDSTLGPYDPLTAKSEAGVCSNQATVTVGGNTDVEGNVLAGVGGKVVVSGSGSVSGITGTLLDPLVGPIVVPPGTSLPLPNSLPTDIVLAPGNYFVSGDLDVKGTIGIIGETHIYVDGNVKVNGNGFLNSSEDPHNLSLEVIGPHTVDYNGNSEFYGALVAPQSDLKLNGTADMFGTIMGADVRLIGNLDVHLDNSLVELDPQGGHAALVR